MALLTLRDAQLSYGNEPLLDGVTLHLQGNERICLLGRNGAGKSTLMRVLLGERTLDGGSVEAKDGIRVAMLRQDVPADATGTVHAVVQEALTDDHRGDVARVDRVISRLSLDETMDFDSLSAGMKRRVFLARALLNDPDVLLLDEPTNHLDIEAIEWLEGFLARFAGTVMFITHDRALVRKVSTRIIELDRGKLWDFPGTYARYLERRDGALRAEAAQEAAFDKKLAEEEAWIRRGIKARRTRNEGRVRALKRLREERKQRRSRVGKAKAAVQEAERSGSLVAEAKGISVGYVPGEAVITDFSTVILRGDRVGIVGPNGCGKTTLLKTLLGELAPQAGTLKTGTRLSVAYFDQLREQLDEDRTVADNVANGADRLQVGDESVHVLGYLEGFLFSPSRARTPVRVLSGGEKNRLMLARLFLKPSNVLVLDEPTNDLDLETLEVLEERIVNYGGTVIVVTHDRDFLNQVATCTLVYEGDGKFVEYAGGWDDLVAQRGSDRLGVDSDAAEAKGADANGDLKDADDVTPRSVPPAGGVAKAKHKTKDNRLSYKEKRELEALPATIEALETEQASLFEKMADPSFLRGASGAIATLQSRLDAIEAELATAFERWEKLEART